MLADDTARIRPRAFAWIAVQVALIVFLVERYQIESPAFCRLMLLGAGGFAVHALLPLAWRLGFFSFLSLGGFILVLGPGGAAFVCPIGVAVLAACHLPKGKAARVTALRWLASASSHPTRSHARGRSWARSTCSGPSCTGEMPIACARFPRPIFCCFPMSAFCSFRSSTRILRGASCRDLSSGCWVPVDRSFAPDRVPLVFHYVAIAPNQVKHAGQLVRFLSADYLLYLRVSGTFHADGYSQKLWWAYLARPGDWASLRGAATTPGPDDVRHTVLLPSRHIRFHG